MHKFDPPVRKLKSRKQLDKLFETVFMSSSDGIWVCDAYGKVIIINEASEKLNGIEAGDIINRKVIDLVRMGVFDKSVSLEVLETKRRVSMLQYVKRTKKYLLVTGTPCFDEEGRILMVVVNERDMTQLNALKDELEQTRMYKEKFKDELIEMSMLEIEKADIIAESESFKNILQFSLKLARLGASNILILGESGTGKGLIAKFIHKNGLQKKEPFIQINCAALPENLLEAELFGYEPGAFTGAKEYGKAGLFELAHGGTLFLDEIGDLPLPVQGKLLKYLDDHEIMRLGSLKPRKVDCKVIAATNRNLRALTRTGRFRQDLFYRLNSFPITIPPLRQRHEDILALANYFVRKYNLNFGMEKRLSAAGAGHLKSLPFKGNVRELENLIKNAAVMSGEKPLESFIFRNSLEMEYSTSSIMGSEQRFSLNEKILSFEKELLQKAITLSNSTREMAHSLMISQPTVVRKLKKHKLAIHPRLPDSKPKRQ